MRIHHLTIDGIGPYATRQEIDVDRLSSGGLFLLTGPTGAGKTTILDAIVYALYGSVPGVRGARGERATSERIVSDLRTLDSQPEVELEFTVAGRRLKVLRVPQHDRPKARGEGTTLDKGSVALSEWSGDAWQPRSNDYAEVATEIEDLLGMNAAQFAQVVLLPQGEFAGFLRANVADRHKVLRRLFQVDEYEAAETWFEERAKAAKAKLDEAQDELASIVDRLAGALDGPAVHPPDELGLEAIDTWITERRFEAEEVDALARVGAEAAATAQASAERARRATDELRVRRAEEARRAAELEGYEIRLPGARRWMVEQGESDLAADDARWSQAAREANDVLSRLDARREDGARITALEAEAARAEASAAQAEQAALTADARVHELAPILRAAQEEAGQGEVAEAQVTALMSRREQLAAALAAVQRRDALARDLTVAEAAAAAAADGLRAARAAAEQLPTVDDAEAALQAVVDALNTLKVETAQRRADHGSARIELDSTIGKLERASSLRPQLDAARRDLAGMTEAWQDARTVHLSAREARLDAMAAELAASLAEGDACPVCGSAHHPAPARPGGGGDLRAVEAAAEERASKARGNVDRASQVVVALEAQLASLGDLTQAARDRIVLTAHIDQLNAALAADAERHGQLAATAEQRRAELARSRDADARVSTAERAAVEAHHAVEASRAAVQSAAEAAGPTPPSAADLHAADAELVRLRGQRAQAAAARDRVQAHEAELERCRAAAGSQRERAASALAGARAAREQAASLRGRLAELIAPHPDLDAALALATRRAQVFEAAADIVAKAAAARVELAAAAEASAAAAEAEQAGDDEPAELAERLEARTTAAGAALAARDDAAKRSGAAQRQLAAIDRARTELDDARAALGPVALEAERLARLDATIRGLGDNRRRISLTNYVLAARLEEVATAATAHLQRMSSGRFSLLHHDERFGNGPAGLGLRVLDAHSGEERETATLSGGEAFYASLALALGLADVVQREAGGRPLETLLVDEGFGALDADTLEDVLGELDELRAAGRAIGLVSHVGALAERIPAQLRVTGGPNGSSARVVVGELVA